MAEEQRAYPRYEVQENVNMKLNEKNILCHVENLSVAGAYMKVNENHNGDVDYVHIGKNVVMEFNSGKNTQNIPGRILRFDIFGKNKFLAVFFLQRYNFES